MSEIVDTSNTEFNEFMHMPIVALRGLTVFPGMNLHFDVGRKKSIAALKNAMNNDQRIFLVRKKMLVLTNRNLTIYTRSV